MGTASSQESRRMKDALGSLPQLHHLSLHPRFPRLPILPVDSRQIYPRATPSTDLEARRVHGDASARIPEKCRDLPRESFEQGIGASPISRVLFPIKPLSSLCFFATFLGNKLVDFGVFDQIFAASRLDIPGAWQMPQVLL